MHIRPARLSLALAIAIALLAPALAPNIAHASPIGAEIASRIDPINYRHYLDDLLFTHTGDNKGIGGAQHDPCRANIVSTLQSFGLTVQLVPFVYQSVTYFNVVATQTGTQFPTAQYIVGAHFDSVNNPGADDDASGVAAMMEIARIVSQYKTKYTIKYIAWDREEQGTRGSNAYVAAHPGDDVRAMIQCDMIAHDVGGRREDIYANTVSAPLENALIAAAAAYAPTLTIFHMGAASFSDHAPFQSAGYQCCCFVEHSYLTFGCYHQPCDSVNQANYIHYDFASDLARTIAGYLADFAQASHPCPADLNGDGSVGAPDLAAVLGSWGMAGGAADLDQNGTVGSGDLAFLLGAWGPCP